MPGMDGFETAGHIKQRERTRHIPILFLTAVDYDPHLAFRGYQAGAVDYITKPFDPWVLRSKVAVFVDLWTMHTPPGRAGGGVRSGCAPLSTTHWRCSTARNPSRWTGCGPG